MTLKDQIMKLVTGGEEIKFEVSPTSYTPCDNSAKNAMAFQTLNLLPLITTLAEEVERLREALSPASEWDAEDDPWKSLLKEARSALTANAEALKKLGIDLAPESKRRNK